MARTVHEPRVDHTRLSINRSSRHVWPPRLIVLHDTEYHDYPGVRELVDLGVFFNRYATRASAHIAVDAEGLTGRYVYDGEKAWHAVDYNSASLGIEQFGYARFTAALWNRNNRAQLKKVAKWIAWWSHKYGIPIQKAEVRNGAVIKPGIATHKMLGSAGGGHVDPGDNYPFWAVLRLARYYKRYGW